MLIVKRVVASVVCAGWLAPLWISLRYIKAWCEADLLPRIDGGVPRTSYPLLDPALFWCTIAMVWLGIAIVWQINTKRARVV